MMQYQQNPRHNPSSSSNNNNHCNTSRRIFRGRGGANDRQHLPKYNTARQRRHENHHHHHYEEEEEEEEESESNRIIDQNDINHYDNDHQDDDIELYRLEIIDPFVTVDSLVTNPVVNNDGRSRSRSNSSSRCCYDDSHTQHIDDDKEDTEKSLLLKEIQHMTRRIRLLRQNWSKSKTGIIIVSTYQTNVIQASLNIIMKEWLSILRRYHYRVGSPPNVECTTSISNRNHNMDNGNESFIQQEEEEEEEERTLLLRPISHEIFLLIQHSIQCGPLTGSQPGYFKRCGSHVAHIVYQYLHTILPMTIQQHHSYPTTTNNNNPTTNTITTTTSSRDDHPSNCHESLSDDDDDDDDDEEKEETAASDPKEHDTSMLRHEQRHYIDSQTQKEQQNENNDTNNDDTINVTFYFTVAQMKTLQAWKQKAYKAAMIDITTNITLDCKGNSSSNNNNNNNKNKAPSKSMIQKEYQAQQIQKEKKRIKAMKGR